MWTVGVVSLVAGIAASVAALVVRFRRATGIEHLQLKQLVFAAALALPSMALAAFLYYDHVIVQILIAAAAPLPPLAAGLAILRYRLYDIDLVINRTIVYGALSAILAAVYFGAVLLLQVVLSPFTEGSAPSVAVSTLAVAAMFRPVRARIQHLVDRRFFREKYDANQTIEQFGHHLRDQLDLQTSPPTCSLWSARPSNPPTPRSGCDPRGRDDRSIVEGAASVADARRHHLVRRRDGPALPGPRVDRRHHQLRPDRPRSVGHRGVRGLPPARQPDRLDFLGAGLLERPPRDVGGGHELPRRGHL